MTRELPVQEAFWSDAAVPDAPAIAREGTRLIEDGFPIGDISLVAEAESWRKEVHRPIYHVHKWWARRLGSVFRAIILGAALGEDEDLLQRFYGPTKLEGLTVFDPFMGSGTTVGEALKLGCTAVGRDINPVAYNAVRAALGPYTKEDLEATMKRLDARVGGGIRDLYRVADSRGVECDVLYHFWVKTVPCPACGDEVRLFSSYVFAKHAYPSKKPTARIVCPSCWGVSDGRYDSTDHECPHCRNRFDPQEGPAKRSKATCERGHEFGILEAVRRSEGPPEHVPYAKLVLREDGTKVYEPITQEDRDSYQACGERLAALPDDWPPGELAAGYNTKQAMSYGYTRWRHFFNDRQRLALTLLARAIREIQDPDVRFAFAILFSGTLEFNNLFASYKGEGTGAVRHMFAHHILKPERTPVEANVWGTPKSSGAFTTLFKSRLLRALEYRESPHEIRVGEATGDYEKVWGVSEPLLDNVRMVGDLEDLTDGAVHLSCGDSADTGIPSRSVDLVVTDPPFFDNVHYSELADFFHAWQRVLLDGADEADAARPTTRSPGEVQDGDRASFARKLADVFSECERVLKPEGLLVFTYHHSRDDGWSAVAEAVANAGFSFVAAQPIKSEMSGAAPKSQAKDPIDIDVALVCRKAAFDDRKVSDVANAAEAAREKTSEQIRQFARKRSPLSAADERIILISQLLVALSAGRGAVALVEAFRQGMEPDKPIWRGGLPPRMLPCSYE